HREPPLPLCCPATPVLLTGTAGAPSLPVNRTGVGSGERAWGTRKGAQVAGAPGPPRTDRATRPRVGSIAMPSNGTGNPDGERGVAADVSLAVAPPAPHLDDADPDLDPSADDPVAGDDVPPPASSIQEGETGDDVFNRLVLPEVDVMWRVALSLTRNRADAEDLVQESLLRAYRAIDTFDGRYPRAWLLTILRNTERNRHRRRRPELLREPEIAEERVPATEPDAVERRAEDAEFDAAVTAALEQLPENFRSVVELVDVDGLTYQEAADV